jgi:hypothetical protein
MGLSSSIAAPAYPYILQFGLSCCGCGSYPPLTPRPPEAVPQCEPRSADKIILKSGVHLPEHARSKLEFPSPHNPHPMPVAMWGGMGGGTVWINKGKMFFLPHPPLFPQPKLSIF